MPTINFNNLTQTGIPFAVEYDGYSEDFEDNTSQITVECICDWNDGTDFRNDMCGYTTWNGFGNYLNRHIPYLDPQSVSRYGMKCKLIKYGGVRDDGDGTLGDDVGWLSTSYARYQVTFKRRKYLIEEDGTGYTGGDKREYQRYTWCKTKLMTRERQVPGLQLQAKNQGKPIPTNGFYADRTISIVATWVQIPCAAIPWNWMSQCINTVNSVAFALPFGDQAAPIVCPIGSLLYKGPANELDPYETATGDLCVDIAHHFDFRPTVPASKQTGAPGANGNWWGWNGVLLPGTAGQWDEIVWAKDGVTNPYQKTDHQNLWIPGAGP